MIGAMSATILGAVRLLPGERVIRHFGASFVQPGLIYGTLATIFIGLYAFQSYRFFLLGAALVCIIGGLQAMVRMQYQWVLTNQRLIQVSGIWTKRVKVIPGDRITDMSLVQPVLYGLLGTGELHVSTAGSDGYEATIFAQHDPRLIEGLLHDLSEGRFA